MLCGSVIQVKVCSSTTTVLTANATSCGTYKLINQIEIAANAVCTPTQLVILNDNEVGNLLASPFNMTTAQGGLIAGKIILVWAIAWGVKQLIKLLAPKTDIQNTED